ncbi:hypothetical protein NE237_011076 [Protea cynaroides]|uniref:Uncharacterized protein n=1 Tax=Protea cynaroides TaxID=273540 RepID=A0A9Q0GX81_9MAGN|nr:hypothetical protein NE237_011076 [Protea cynaroides]
MEVFFFFQHFPGIERKSSLARASAVPHIVDCTCSSIPLLFLHQAFKQLSKAVMARSGRLSSLNFHLRESPLINPRLVRPELKISRVPLLSVRTKNARNSPTILLALLKMGLRGVTVSDFRGFGVQGGSTERHAGI